MPFGAAAVSSPDNLRDLACGLCQLAPDGRMTVVQRGATNPSFAYKQAPIVSVAVAGQGVFSVTQGKLEPQILQWLQTDGRLIIDACLDLPAPERMRSSAASVERDCIIEEGGFAGCESPSGSV